MALIPGAVSPGPEHEAALDWAVMLLRKVDDLDLEQLKAEWNGAEKTHRAQLEKTGHGALRQLWVCVRERHDFLKRAA